MTNDLTMTKIVCTALTNDDKVTSDLLFRYLNDLIMNGEIERFENELKLLDLTLFNTYSLTTIACTLYMARNVTSVRPEIMERIEKRIIEITPERAEKLLRGLKMSDDEPNTGGFVYVKTGE